MPKTDKDIGETVARLREQIPQRDIAGRMTKRGFRWTQGTVSSIEKGERSLKFTEAAELAAIFGVPVNMFLIKVPDADAYVRLRDAIERFTESCHTLHFAVRSVLATKRALDLSRSLAEKVDVADWADEEAKNELQLWIKEAQRLSETTVETVAENAKASLDKEEQGLPS